MWIAETVQDLRARRVALRGAVAFVPTMGALHRGHLALIERAHELGGHVVVSIFVNPTQFGPGEDLEAYPRPREADLSACREAGVAGVFAPTVDQVYPPDELGCAVDVPGLTGSLEGAHRPGHFQGVCRVVAKLFNMVQPDVACFGQKDYQQWRVIEAMARSLAMPVRVVGCPTVRDGAGLALSSRNAYLDAAQRERALGLYKALLAAKELVEREGETDPAAVERAMQRTMQTHNVLPHYAAVRHPRTLAELDCIEPGLTGGVVALVAGKVDDVRLIDNMVLGNDQ